jgi:hypothetical protein
MNAPFSAPDHGVLMDCGHYTHGLDSSVDLVMDFAARGEAHKAALTGDAGIILGAWMRLGNLIEELKLRSAP